MEIDNYYRFKKVPNNKTRYELNYHSGHCKYLHRPDKHGRIKLGLSDYCYIKNSNSLRKADYAISMNNVHLSSVYFPSIENPHYAYADYENDCLLVIRKDEIIEILIFKDKKPFTDLLFQMLCEGELTEQLEQLRLSN
jgi:hypothetical protein